jgi:hypothetical protein
MTKRLRCVSLLWCASLLAAAPGFGQTSRLTRQEISRDLFTVAPAVQATTIPAEQGASKKSVGLAILYSLVIPGMGELYADGFASGKYFLLGEGALWITYAAFEIHGNDLRDGARAYAAAHAGVVTNGKDDQFFVDVGNFASMDDYNDKRLRDRDISRLYSVEGGQYWLWDSQNSRAAFREQRIASESAYNGRKFVVAAIVINHVVSAINAARAAISHNRSLQESLGQLELSSRVLGAPGQEHGVMVTLSRSF